MTGKILCFAALVVLGVSTARGQNTDTLPPHPSIDLQAVEITAPFSRLPILGFPASAQTIPADQIQNQQTTTLLPALNSVPGIRMEERSPGSYRLAMRGSLIRSPFGVRNVKIYIDEFPLTDAGGNTYLNLIDPRAIAAIHVLKGPDGSVYGANSGGVISIQPHGFEVRRNRSSLTLGGGSFGLFQERLAHRQKVSEKYSFSVDHSFMRSDGYRDHSAMDKATLQTAHEWKYSPQGVLRLFALYADLNYLTPGGLTESQMRENPRMARPAQGNFPSAPEQKAGVQNKTFFGGLAHETAIGGNFTHSVSVFGSHTRFENPFITNYEFRKEKNIGTRTYLTYESESVENLNWQMQLGFEGQMGWNRIDNFDNHGGTVGEPQAKDQLNNVRSTFFYRAMAELFNTWTVEASLGLNRGAIDYETRYPQVPNPDGRITFDDVWMPRVAASHILAEGLAVRGAVSVGFSPPTIAEIRSSDNTINTDLKAETGVNYEVGLRMETPNGKFLADAAFFIYRMDNGIVRHLRESGAEYYTNAGEIDQKGLEASLWWYPLSTNRDGFIENLVLHAALTYNHFRFGTYRVNDEDFSGNKVTAVPDWVWIGNVNVSFPKGFGLNAAHNFTSRMPLDDGNTVWSEEFHLLQVKGTWETAVSSKFRLRLFAGVDNVLNEKYSLGNDINAFGNRYFNPAPIRNFYAGLELIFY
ncbi:MAG TPA: TonB-dependent receptor [Cryomorphaceae bacterium]|nr:TonB-dependent receptor [Cryomorphaceae bacterium]